MLPPRGSISDEIPSNIPGTSQVHPRFSRIRIAESNQIPPKTLRARVQNAQNLVALRSAGSRESALRSQTKFLRSRWE